MQISIVFLQNTVGADEVTNVQLVSHVEAVLTKSTKITKVIRWESDINISANKEIHDNKSVISLIDNDHSDINSYLPIKIQWSEQKDNVNFLIYYYDPENFESQMLLNIKEYRFLSDENFINDLKITARKNSGCNLRIATEFFKIKRAVLFVSNKYHFSQVLTCYLRSLMKALGVIGEAKDSNSVLFPKYRRPFISPLDHLTLQILYHPNVKAGLDLNILQKMVQTVKLGRR